MPEPKSKRPRTYPVELRERAVRLVRETAEREGTKYRVVQRIAAQLGIDPARLGEWVRRDELGHRPVASDDQRRIAELEQENRELRRANEILKAASTFFAAELDRHEQK